MMNARSFVAAILLSLSWLAGCAVTLDDALDTASSEVQMTFGPQLSDWAVPPTSSASPQGFLGGEIATLNGTTYLVRSDRCGAWSCWGDYQDLYWSKWTGTGWSPGVKISGQRAGSRVSLAAFNGYLYMLHTGESDESAVWLSKFDPSTETWATNYLLGYTTFDGPPAIAAFDGKLHLVGIDESCRMWSATLSTTDTPSIARTIAGHTSCTRPSIAAFDGKLYMVHSAVDTGGVYLSYRNPAPSINWSPDKYIHTGTNGAALIGYEPVIASVEGYLHLVFRNAGAGWVWWTYFDGCKWPAPVSLYTWQTSYRLSLTQGGAGLLLATTSDATWNTIVETRNIAVEEFHAPPGPLDPPLCGVAAP